MIIEPPKKEQLNSEKFVFYMKNSKRQSKETSLIPQIKVKLLSGFFFALAKLSLKDLSKK